MQSRNCARPREHFRSGFYATLPLAPGVIAFGLVYGMAARQVGLSSLETLLMSLGVFADAAQLSALQVWSTTSGSVIILVTLIVNLRYLLMSASLAPYLQNRHWFHKVLGAFMLSDESYALAMGRFLSGQVQYAYLLGANLGLYLQWAVASLAGVLLGSSLPDLSACRLDLIFPFVFLGFLIPQIQTRIALVVTLLAGALALGGSVLLPGSWYILVAGLGGSLGGALLECAWKTR